MITYKTAMPLLTLKYTPSEYMKVKVRSSRELVDVVRELFNPDTIGYREEMVVVYLNQANNTVGASRHTTGGTAQTVVDPKIILTEALLAGATALAISHNHPSGQLIPSREDEKITVRLKMACETIGIRMVDHIIVPGEGDGYYSFADEGKMN